MVFEFETMQEVYDKIESKDLILSQEIYKQIKKAFYSKTKRKKVIILSIKLKHDMVDFILERDQWVISLNTCLNVFADNDLFEECIDIQKMLLILNNEK
jgi:hypothetical protein